ncbi:MAG TPA: hypothetical protein VHK69_03965 [Chitinophagaceae bacterium]|jgi:hypothetical protein|nr:hypothetical protein [Chitinophagaceae bacterium]
MSVFTFLVYVFLAYMAYRLVFGFILPVYRTTRRVKRTFREMQDRMQEQQARQQSAARPEQPAQGKMEGLGDYIDFEEVK